MRIYGIPYAGDGSGYYRIHLPLRGLGDRYGHDVDFPVHDKYEFWIESLDVLVGQRFGRPEGVNMWAAWPKDKCKLVYEIDDDVWAPDSPLRINHELQYQMALCAGMANLVTVTTESLADRLRQFNPNVAVLPNYIDPDLLALAGRAVSEPVTIGWQGSPTHLQDLVPVLPQIRRFLGRNPDIDFHMMGADYRTLVYRGNEVDRIRFTPWQADLWKYYESIDFDIGIAPLVDSTFNRSKSAIKVIEYAALGIPVVASDVPAYRDYVEHGVTGFLVKEDWEWGGYLHRLAKDSELRERMGLAAHERSKEWTMSSGVDLWEKAYASL